ncbi:MAG: alpha-galactosidase [Ruminococcaceae bacterium]|nr:alpha-galactosidase [Oscillospiraceae bacterium]
MPIVFDKENRVFYLHTKHTSYIMGFLENYLVHVYWGKRLEDIGEMDTAVPYRSRSCAPYSNPENADLQADHIPLEFPTYGSTDLRMPAYHAQYADGSTVSDFRYVSHRIFGGKPILKGLPATYADESEAQTLELCMRDEKTGVALYLLYTVFEHKDAITRSVRVENNGTSVVNIQKLLSANVDFYGMDYDLITLCGATIRERYVQRKPLAYGTMTVESARGASSHGRNPFIALVSRNATENSGEAYGMSFVYSGNFTAGVSVDLYDMSRMFIGLNPFDFNWRLEAGETFTAPEVVMVYSDCGIGGMSRIYHSLYRDNLCRGKYAKEPRPVLINSWETVYFDFNEEKLLEIARNAKEIGVELMVLDDGWFGERNDDKSSLGDWTENKAKLPNGLKGLADKVEDMGMKFGLWLEPEMISPVSKLYEEHPDWCLHVPGRTRSLGRNQLILDFANPEVCDYIYHVIRNILKSAKISYIKWDMNRNMSEIGSAYLPPERQRETAHRYMLGLYGMLEKLVTEFDQVLFESCSAGGGRFDAGMLYYMPQTWTSDNSDAVERMKIQYGTSLVYPALTMGAHISAVPNHQVHRTTSMETRGNIAIMGQFGLELDLKNITEQEREAAAECIRRFKALRNTIHYGDMYRLNSPFDGNIATWQFISEDKKQVVICVCNILAEANGPFHIIKPEGLEPDGIYEDTENGIVRKGSTLMQIGLPHLTPSDFGSKIYVFNKR